MANGTLLVKRAINVMIYEPRSTRPAWFTLSEAEGYSGVFDYWLFL